MRIVIADDEQWVRAALKSMLLEIDPELEIAGEAADGQQMMKVIEICQPDMAFVDIRMPGMDGLEAIERVKAASRDTSWVILSGFSDFPYAQKAITLGVKEYLLKPVKLEELRLALENVRSIKEAGKKSKSADFQHFLISSYYSSGMGKSENGYFDSFTVRNMEICLDTWKKGGGKKEIEDRMKLLLHLRMEELEEQGSIYVSFFEIPSERYMLAVGFTPEKAGKEEETAKWFYSLRKEFQKISDKDCSVTGFFSPGNLNGRDAMEYMKKQETFECMRTIMGMNTVWELQEMHAKSSKCGKSIWEFCRAVSGISEGMRSRSYLNFLDCVVKAEKGYDACYEKLSENMHARVKQFLLTTTGLYRVTEAEPGGLTVREIFREIREHAKKLLTDSDGQEERWDVVKFAEEYIRMNYAKDISIGQLADSLKLTPNYLSAVFHKGVGTTFVKYLTRVRMDRAEELLQNENLTINQVASLTGYTDTRYFARVFKEYFGILPSEYGKRRKKG